MSRSTPVIATVCSADSATAPLTHPRDPAPSRQLGRVGEENVVRPLTPCAVSDLSMRGRLAERRPGKLGLRRPNGHHPQAGK
jgi:hypothetical protein